ncbi:MAG: hypothetical protein MUC49_15650 [Raineya sp.]|nr:hypothetical protein [Raineya sp.]
MFLKNVLPFGFDAEGFFLGNPHPPHFWIYFSVCAYYYQVTSIRLQDFLPDISCKAPNQPNGPYLRLKRLPKVNCPKNSSGLAVCI